ncbi:hypothetical protein TNCV_3641851 [Trichonephila clavipes]|nr:hypothetical protein TNCV_3641851 [Trichonephila clavipes]
MCSRRYSGEVVLEVRRLQKTDISSYQQRNRRTTGKGPISHMQYHGVGRIMINGRTRLHVVANGTMTGYTNDTLMKFYFLMFVFYVVLSVINLFLWTTTQHHRTLLSRLSRQRGYSTFVWPACSPDINPLKMCRMLWGGKVAGRSYPPTKQEHPLIRALTETNG